MRYKVDLPLRDESAAEVRDYILRLSDHVDDEMLDDLRLLVNELVTNSIQHAPHDGGLVSVVVALEPDRVRVEVADQGNGFSPPTKEPTLEQTSGRGLYLVEQIADRWGLSSDGRTLVWFELDRSA